MNIYKDESYSFEERAADLVSRMTLEEKISQLSNVSAAIPRLGVPFYNYMSEASHGFFGPFKFREMDVTSFPVCLAMSQSWDKEKIKKVTTAISDECRAYHNLNGDEIHFWCPTINLGRDPRNGRSDENFGEDPFLAGKMAASYIQGMQGGDKKYLKTISTPKHFALNSSENNRHTGSSNVDEATLREYYLKVFEYAVREGHAQSIMTSYNRINGVPASCNEKLLQKILREEWGFDGFVVSDCGAVADAYANNTFPGDDGSAPAVGHCYAKSMKEAAVMSILSGTDLCCGTEYKHNLLEAIEDGMITEADIEKSLIRIYTSRFRLGLFDQKEHIPFCSLGKDNICSEENAKLAVDMANDTIVLLKNEKQILPLKGEKGKKILVIGPNALYRELGGYSAGSMSRIIDTRVNIMALEGIRNIAGGYEMEVQYEKGWCSGREFAPDGIGDMILPQDILEESIGPNVKRDEVVAAVSMRERHKPEDPDYRADNEQLFSRALEAAKKADYVIVVAGTDQTTAAEEKDRENLELPYGQDEKLQKLLEVNNHTVIVLMTLGAVTGKFFEQAHTVINAHFAGEAQGTALANILFGKVNPNAKLTSTWYRSTDELPHLFDYGIRVDDTMDKKGRTYMYYKGEALFPFGYGLSYTSYEYSNLKLNKRSIDANDTLCVSVDVRNTGTYDGAEIVQLYITKLTAEGQSDNKPIRQLKGFEKVFIKAGECSTVEIQVPLYEVAFWSNYKQKMIIETGAYRLDIGRSSADIAVSARFEIKGEWSAPIENVTICCHRQILRKNDIELLDIHAALADTSHLDLRKCEVSYQSTNKLVVDVDETGIVTAKGSGAATVIVTVKYGEKMKSGSIPFVVKE